MRVGAGGARRPLARRQRQVQELRAKLAQDRVPFALVMLAGEADDLTEERAVLAPGEALAPGRPGSRPADMPVLAPGQRY
jgi:hypothetical protein